MPLESLLNVAAPAAVATAIAALLSRFMRPMLLKQGEVRKKRAARVKGLIDKKIGGDIELTSQDIIDIGRGAGVSQGLAIDALYQLFAEAEDKEKCATVKKLISEIQREEPFESLAPEARPSLARISTLCEQSDQETDRELLHPITKLLEEHQEMRQERASIKRQGRISYVVALVSFFIGVVGLILAFRSPSKGFIENQLEGHKAQILEELQRSPTTE